MQKYKSRIDIWRLVPDLITLRQGCNNWDWGDMLTICTFPQRKIRLKAYRWMLLYMAVGVSYEMLINSSSSGRK